MGVKFLWSYVNKNKDQAVSYVDLVEMAKSYPGRMNILVDFYSWEHFIKEKFLENQKFDKVSNYFMYAGGEYSLMDECLRCIIQELRNVNIEPIFYLDGAKGSAECSTKHKLQTWRSRCNEADLNLKKTFKFLRGEIPSSKISLERLTRPCLQEVQNVLTLQDLGCKLYLRVSGEADYMIAKHLSENQQAYGILSNDTDFSIFPDSVFLAQHFFDLNKELGKEMHLFRPGVPKNLVCGIIRPESIMRLLGLNDHKSLVELAIIGGNDFTTPYLTQKDVFRKYYEGRFDLLSQLINKNGCVEKCEFFGKLMETDSDFRNAVYHSREFYTLTLSDEEEPQKDYIFNLIADDIRAGKLPSTIVSMHRGIYWHRQIMEDPDNYMPVAEEVLSSLRAYIYTILLPHHKHYTVETGRSSQNSLTEMKIYKVNDQHIPSLAQVKNNNLITNMLLFETILQHQERAAGFYQPYFLRFGIHDGFKCLLLRYFLLMNWHQNLRITPQEFYILVTWVMGKHEVMTYYRLKLLPSPRCITLESWFQSLYRNAYAFLGNTLNLSHQFPSPKDMFSSSTWVALFTACSLSCPYPNDYFHHPSHVPVDQLLQARQVVVDTIRYYRPLVETIIYGVFLFDDRGIV